MNWPDDYLIPGIEPFHVEEAGIIYCGDCRGVLPHLPKVDLVLTDPNYGIGIAKNGTVGGERKVKLDIVKNNIVKNYGPQKWDLEIPSEIAFKEMLRVSRNQIIFGGNYFIEYLKNSPCWIVWDKDNTGNFADCELAWTSFKTAVRKFKWRWNGIFQENMAYKDERVHPTQKPIALMKWCLKNYSKIDHIILDPFLGSGTTAVAAKELGRKFIGIEISPEYCEIAVKRLRQGVLNFD